MLADRRLWMAVRSIRASTSTATASGMSSDSASSTFVASTFAPGGTNAAMNHYAVICISYLIGLPMTARLDSNG